MKRSIKFIVLTVLFSLVVIGCKVAPITGRKQLNLVNREKYMAEMSELYNQFIAAEKAKGNVLTNTADGKRVVSIGKKIISSVEKYMSDNNMADKLKGFDWEINLLRTEEANAWAMEGGKIAFYTGILPILKTDDSIAFVMGHEIGHAIAGHNSERKSQTNLSGWLMLGKSIADVVTNGATSVIDNDLIGTGLSMGLQKFSRNNELEADKYGMIFMAMAGYDPSKAIETWEKMMANSGNKKFTLMDSHPSDESRVKAMKKFLPEAMKYYKK